MTTSPEPVRVALDAMGGDQPPAVRVAGAAAAAREHGVAVILVGQSAVLEPLLAAESAPAGRLTIQEAPDVIAMAEHPAQAVRAKPQSSVVVGLNLVKEGAASAFVSAGHSGATVAASLFRLGRIEGVARPALGTTFPALQGHVFLIDVGATTDCKPEWLLQFAQMGACYVRGVFNVQRPRIGLLSNGEEESKGNRLVQEAHQLLKANQHGYQFHGNVEGKEIVSGAVDVVVCDGFDGNVLIKTAEAAQELIFQGLRQELTSSLKNRLAAAILRPAFRRVAMRLDYTEYGGAPLLGVNGVSVVSHGRSDAKAIKSAVRVAAQAARQGVVAAIAAGVTQTRDDGEG